VSNQINDGGPAFPTPGEQFIDGPQGKQPASAWGMDGKPGMSLRAYYVGHILGGMAAGPFWNENFQRCESEGRDANEWVDNAAKAACLAADAAIRELSNETVK